MISSKLSLVKEMVRWPLSYIHFRLYTMYGSKYYVYLIKHPLILVRDLNRYLNWCIQMDKLR